MTERARDIALELTSWPSVTGTDDEVAFAARLSNLIAGSEILRRAGVRVETMPVPLVQAEATA
jgi:arginine utilization protein RocB